MKDRQRVSGAPYELALPGARWIRVIERRGTTADGRGYFSYVDITVLKRQQEELRQMHAEQESLAVTDALTGLANRRRFDEALVAEWRRSTRGTGPLSLLMIDVDSFKQLNDEFGHPFGDEVLRRIAEVLKAGVHRVGDLAARYGGEEFAMLLPRTELKAAASLAEAMRLAVESLRIDANRHSCLLISISIGVSSAIPNGPNDPPTSLVERADAALYQAKRNGRNQVALG